MGLYQDVYAALLKCADGQTWNQGSTKHVEKTTPVTNG